MFTLNQLYMVRDALKHYEKYLNERKEELSVKGTRKEYLQAKLDLYDLRDIINIVDEALNDINQSENPLYFLLNPYQKPQDP